MIDDLEGLPRKLMVGIPAYTGQLTVQTHRTVSTIVQCCAALGIEAWAVTFAGCCYLDLARNELVRQLLASDADALLFLDADIGAEPTAIAKLMQARKAVVAGIYPKKTSPLAWPVAFDRPQFQVAATGALEAAGVPTGFLLVARQVFEAMQPHVTRYWNDQRQEHWAFFETRIEYDRYWGEDFVFCRTWRQLGGKIWMVPDIQFEHVGMQVWAGSYAQWYLDRPSWEKIDGWHHTPELYLDALDAAQDGAIFVEVGAWKGRSTAFMAEHILATKKRIVFDVVDHFRGSAELMGYPEVTEKRLQALFEANVAYCRDGIHAVHVLSSLEAAPRYADASLDWVFLDASHDVEDVADDCAAWWPKVKPGGALAGDDWAWASVRAGVQRYFEALPGDFTLEPVGAGWRIAKPSAPDHDVVPKEEN